jgi:hypothetical protein
MSYDSIELTLSSLGEQLPDRPSPSFESLRADFAGRCPKPEAIKRDCDEPALRDVLNDPTHSSRPPSHTTIEVRNPTKPAFSIFVVAALLLASSSAEAARGTGGNSNLILPPPPVVSTAPPQTNPIGGVNTGQSFGAVPGLPQFDPIGGVGTGQNFGALPGQPGSPTYDPNAALPSLGNAGSALAPAGTSGLTAPSTSIGTSTSR